MRFRTALIAAFIFAHTGAYAAPADRRALFGDLHLHTSMSFDAYTMQTNTLPEDSYRFAIGEEVEYLGRKVKRHVPLDFLAVTDHSEYLGVIRTAADPNGPFANTQWPQLLKPTTFADVLKTMRRIGQSFNGDPIPEFRTDELVTGNWQRQIAAAEKYNRPGRFTTFVGYEWTSMPDGENLHRNVIFKGPKYPERPFAAIDSRRPEDLWAFLDRQRELGIASVAIPHNSNASNGRMFGWNDSNGAPIDRAYAEARARNERLVEVTQVKGTSEASPELSPTDEFADYELLHQLLIGNSPSQPAGSYVRDAYRRGLEIGARVGTNPFEFGLVGGSDFHSGVSASEEDNFPGAHGIADNTADPKHVLDPKNVMIGRPAAALSAAGITGVWAEENTREAVFSALERRETFATTGPRLQARLFAGWSYPTNLAQRKDWVSQAYAAGVPQGAELTRKQGSTSGAPRFLVQAVKDPDGANLDRIQIVKVWLEQGKSTERVYDVVWSGGRKRDSGGKVPAVGNTVDLKRATYTNAIGATELRGEWVDPDFDANAPAVYYARVLEIPTPRWSTYLAVRSGVPIPNGVPPVFQERAWTSPVFYRP
jgi:hypothetical protein